MSEEIQRISCWIRRGRRVVFLLPVLPVPVLQLQVRNACRESHPATQIILGNGPYRGPDGDCTITIELVCREMPSDPSGMFYHCFLAVKDSGGNYIEAVSGIADDKGGSPTEGMTISAVCAGCAQWDLDAIQTVDHDTFPFGLPVGQDDCDFLKMHGIMLSIYRETFPIINTSTIVIHSSPASFGIAKEMRISRFGQSVPTIYSRQRSRCLCHLRFFAL